MGNNCLKLNKSNSQKLPSSVTEEETIVYDNRDGYFSPEDVNKLKEKYPGYREWETQMKQAADLHRSNDVKHRSIKWKEAEVIGHGSFGKVVLGLNLENGALMAVKQVHIPGGLKAETTRNRIDALESEIDLLSKFDHKNIVRYIGATRNQSGINIFMEYIAGGTISSLIDKYGKFNETLIRVYVKQILEGLEYLHARNTIHRDIKGANVLVDNTGVCKLADFGSAKQVYNLIEGDAMYSLKGTANWMAPEVVMQKELGRFSDIWSVGCVVIEMATGRPPWHNCGNQIQTLLQIAKAKNPPPLPKGLSAECQDFLRLCFRMIPRERPNVTKLLKHRFIANFEEIYKSPDMITEDTSLKKTSSSEPLKKHSQSNSNDLEKIFTEGEINVELDPQRKRVKSAYDPPKKPPRNSGKKAAEDILQSHGQSSMSSKTHLDSTLKEPYSKLSDTTEQSSKLHSFSKSNIMSKKKSNKKDEEFDSIEYLSRGDMERSRDSFDENTLSHRKYQEGMTESQSKKEKSLTESQSKKEKSMTESQIKKEKSSSYLQWSLSKKSNYRKIKEEDDEEAYISPKTANALVVKVNSKQAQFQDMLLDDSMLNLFRTQAEAKAIEEKEIALVDPPKENDTIKAINNTESMTNSNRNNDFGKGGKYKTFSYKKLPNRVGKYSPGQIEEEKADENSIIAEVQDKPVFRESSGRATPREGTMNILDLSKGSRGQTMREEESQMNFSRIQLQDNHLMDDLHIEESRFDNSGRINTSHEVHVS